MARPVPPASARSPSTRRCSRSAHRSAPGRHGPGADRTAHRKIPMPRPHISNPSPRPAMTLVSRRTLWPSSRKYPGIANGWHGAAWVAFKLAGVGTPVPHRVFDAVGRRLAADLGGAARTGHVGAFIGGAADAVIAAYAARHGVASAEVARQACNAAVAAADRSGAWDVHMGLAGTLLALGEIAAIAPAALRDVPTRRLAARL